MNILPKKRWHVRTKENIARVRKDEAEAAEKERQEKLRIDNADREARLNALKQKSKQKLIETGIVESTTSSETPPEHVNLFHDFDNAIKKPNKAHDEEVKEKREEYEKKIGFLTYLGQDTNEALKKKNWYEVVPESTRFSRSGDIKDTYEKLIIKDKDGTPKPKELDNKNGEVSWKSKQSLDPINAFRKYCHNPKNNKSSTLDRKERVKDKHKDKCDKNVKEDKKAKLLKLREARLKREREERRKTEMFLRGMSGETENKTEKHESTIKQKYNSQFNPELARQNYR